jgi:hypothetical protein
MLVTYRGPRGRITRIGTLEVEVRPGVPVELPDALARRLAAQHPDDWDAGELVDVATATRKQLLAAAADLALEVPKGVKVEPLREIVLAAMAAPRDLNDPDPTPDDAPPVGEED